MAGLDFGVIVLGIIGSSAHCEDKELIVLVLKIGHRREVYRDL